MDRYAKTYTVRWSDCDLNGHLRNTAYSEYGTDTRISFFTERGFHYDEFVARKLGLVILHESIDYLREVRLGESFEVEFRILGLSPDGARFKIEHEMWLPGRKKAARIVLAGGWMDMEVRKLRLPPDDLLRVVREAPRAEGFEEMKPLRSSA